MDEGCTLDVELGERGGTCNSSRVHSCECMVCGSCMMLNLQVASI